MQNEVVRMLADGLADPTVGVNAYLPTVPRDPGDPVPPPVTVIDETRDPKAARRQNAGKDETDPGPELWVGFVDPFEIAPDTTITQLVDALTVHLRYKARNAKSADAIRDGYYTLRAVRRSLNELRKNQYAALFVRNGIQLVEITSLQHYPGHADDDEQIVTGLVATCTVEDILPEW